MILGPDKWYVLAESLRQAIHADLTVKPDRSGVVPGAIAWDECDCGLLAVTYAQIYPSEVFPDLITNPAGNCEASVEVGELVIQLIRCTPGPDPTAPSVAALDASARELLRDAYELITSVRSTLCQFEADRDILSYLLRPLVPQGPSGDCGGNELRVFVSLLKG
jgi:hypothetical protein